MRNPVVLDAHNDKDVVRGAVDFSVRLEPAYVQGPDGLTAIPKRFAVVREDNNLPLSVISNEYTLVEHRTILDTIENAIRPLDLGVVPRGIYLSKDGAKMEALFKFPTIAAELAPGDVICPLIKVKNSYDGCSKISMMIGAFRFVCTNLAVGGGGCFASGFLAFHTGEINIGKVGEDLSNYLQSFDKIVDLYRAWMDTRADQDAINQILVDGLAPKHVKRLQEKMTLESVFKAYNVCTDYATHQMTSSRVAFDALDVINRGFQHYFPIRTTQRIATPLPVIDVTPIEPAELLEAAM